MTEFLFKMLEQLEILSRPKIQPKQLLLSLLELYLTWIAGEKTHKLKQKLGIANQIPNQTYPQKISSNLIILKLSWLYNS